MLDWNPLPQAALWEVGVYLTLPHQNGPSICQNLAWQQQMLEKFQKKKEEVVAQVEGTSYNTHL